MMKKRKKRKKEWRRKDKEEPLFSGPRSDLLSKKNEWTRSLMLTMLLLLLLAMGANLSPSRKEMGEDRRRKIDLRVPE